MQPRTVAAFSPERELHRKTFGAKQVPEQGANDKSPGEICCKGQSEHNKQDKQIISAHHINNGKSKLSSCKDQQNSKYGDGE